MNFTFGYVLIISNATQGKLENFLIRYELQPALYNICREE